MNALNSLDDLSIPRLTIILVTWNSAATIGPCLDSVRDSEIAGGVETILFDNDSTDGTAELAARAYPEISLLRSPENLGFAGANNRCMAMAAGEIILLLNPDTVLADSGAIARMLDTLDANPGIAMLGPRLTFEDGAHQVGDAGFRPSTANMIAHGLGLAHLIRGLRTLYVVRPDRYRPEPQVVDWVCGACLMVRRDIVRSAGGMDERLFLYAEDVEWGARLCARGLRVAYLPHVTVQHLQGRSEAQAGAAISTRWLTSLLELYVRLNGPRWRPLVCLAFAAGFLTRASAYRVLSWIKPARAFHYAARAAALTAYATAALRFQANTG